MSIHRPDPKAALRQRMMALRKALPPEDAAWASARATEHLLAQPELSSEAVCCFVSFRREIETRPVLQALLDRDIAVGVPRMVADYGLECRRIRSLDELVPGPFGVLTSDGEDLGDRVGAVVTPGLAFTPEGGRLGFGAGYYDRYLGRLDAKALGFGFERQLVPELPTEDHDHPLHAVVTEAGVHRGWPERAVRVVGGVLVRDGRIFAARRGPGTSQAGWWEIPGGKVEPGETEAQALERELREELAIEVAVREPIALSIHPYPHVEVALAAWTCDLLSGTPTPTEHDRIGWFGPDELQALPWAPADIPLVHAMVALLR